MDLSKASFFPYNLYFALFEGLNEGVIIILFVGLFFGGKERSSFGYKYSSSCFSVYITSYILTSL